MSAAVTPDTVAAREPMTVRERYTRAIGSKHLQLKAHSMGDTDMLIAAGWVDNTLGSMLCRLASEYDLVRGDVALARAYRSPLRDQADREDRALVHKKARLHGPSRAPQLLMQAEQEERRTSLQARALALLQLKSLHSTATVVGNWACVMATRLQVMLDDRTVKVMAGRVLDVWIDPVCDLCHGTGALGVKQQPCRACSGTGRRSSSLGKSIEEIYLARSLLAAMDRATAEFDVQVKHHMSEKTVDRDAISA